MLVVLVVLGLIVAMAPAAYHGLVPGVQAKSSARSVAAVFREARSLAIRDNREAVVTVDTEARTLSLDRGGRVHSFDEDLRIVLLTAASEQLDENAGRIRFYPDGTSTGGRVTFAAGEEAYHVDIDWLTGRVRIGDQDRP